jgi:hypothetical protein
VNHTITPINYRRATPISPAEARGARTALTRHATRNQWPPSDIDTALSMLGLTDDIEDSR